MCYTVLWSDLASLFTLKLGTTMLVKMPPSQQIIYVINLGILNATCSKRQSRKVPMPAKVLSD